MAPEVLRAFENFVPIFRYIYIFRGMESATRSIERRDRHEDETPAASGQVHELPSYESLIANSKIFGRTDEISKFNFIVNYQNNGALTYEDVAEAVVDALLGNLTDTLTSTGLHYLHEVKPTVQRANRPGSRLDGSEPVVTIGLKHPVHKFEIRVYGDKFVITRLGSSFTDFYAWYRRLMPSAAQLEATVRQAVARKLGRPLDVTRSSFEFEFIFSDFSKISGNGDRDPRNVDVLSKLVSHVPTHQGKTELSQQDFLRIDLTFSRLEKFEDDKYRNCWYTLEAPSNERGRFIVFNAQLRNESVDKVGAAAAESPSIPFDPDFIEDYLIAITEFLKPRALDNFMLELLDGWEFQTERQI